MAAGDLSPDQSRYVDRVASGTGLDRTAVVAWVGTESGWGTNKAGHNYLNVGPGETYTSVDMAAARVVGLLQGSNLYYGIRAAIPAGPGVQIQAIGASRWGTNATLLSTVYGQLVNRSAAVGSSSAAPTAEPVSWLGDAAGAVGGALGAVGNALGGAAGAVAGPAAGAVTGAVSDAFKALGPIFLEVGLQIVFTVAAFAFIAMGVNRLTGNPAKAVFDTVTGAVGTAAGAAKLAAI